jgi:1-acyl-sn-glycerol-3-phosphate acyltransferase
MLFKYLRLLGAFSRAFWILWFRFPALDQHQKLDAFQQWSHQLLKILGVDVRLLDSPLAPGTKRQAQLLVANHISWLDVIVIQSLQPCVFVAKKEVRQWPLIGPLADACGVVFVDRSSSSSARKMVDAVTQAFKDECCVAGFPEGTSSDGREVGTFHASLFEAAIAHKVQVQPVALRYIDRQTGALCRKAAYFGDISFSTSLKQVLCASSITVTVQISAPLMPEGHSRRSLAQLSQRSISAQLGSTPTQEIPAADATYA